MSGSILSRDEPFILAVAGAKQGVGKSFISSNMAVLYAKAGLKTIFIDHRLNEAHFNALLRAKNDDTSPLHKPLSPLENLIMNQEVPNLLLIPGSSMGLDFTSITNIQRNKFFKQLREITSADIVIIDLNGGATEQTLDIFLMAHAGLLVVPTEQADLIDAYGFLKSAVYRTVFRICRGQEDLQQTITSLLTETQRKRAVTIEEVADAIAKKNPWLATILLQVCEDFDFYTIFNQSHSPNDVQLASKLHQISEKSLDIDLNFPGLIFQASEVTAEASGMTPISISHPESVTCKALNRISRFILEHMESRIIQGEKKTSFEEQLELAQRHAQEDFSHIHHPLGPL